MVNVGWRSNCFVNGRFLLLIGLIVLILLGVWTTIQINDESLPSIFFLNWNENGIVQVFRIDSGKEPMQLTNVGSDVYDFAVAPDGSKISFSVVNSDGSSQIWRMNGNGRGQQLLLSCEIALCTDLVWHPDGRRLLFERREVVDGGNASYLWWLDAETGDAKPLLESGEHGAAARFSPDGQRVSYFSPEQEGIQLFNFVNGRRLLLPNQIGTPGIWSPDGKRILFSDLNLVTFHGGEDDDHLEHSHEYATAVHIFVAEVDNPEPQRISPDIIVDDGNPAWSPDGAWIAFGRKPPGTDAGRQLWLMRPDGSEARALTDDLGMQHGPVDWLGNGRILLFQRFDTQNPETRPGIWLFNIEKNELIKIAPAGMQPQWGKSGLEIGDWVVGNLQSPISNPLLELK